jgi:hypothetical protein
LEADGSGLSFPPKVIDSERGINANFKRVASRTAAAYPSRTLDAAVAGELQDLERIVFALVGTIGERETVSVPLARMGELQHLTFDPSQTELVAVDNLTLSVRKLDGIDELWRSVEALAASSEMELGPDAAESFDAAFTVLREEVGRRSTSTRFSRTAHRSLPRYLRELVSRSTRSRQRWTATRPIAKKRSANAPHLVQLRRRCQVGSHAGP